MVDTLVECVLEVETRESRVFGCPCRCRHILSAHTFDPTKFTNFFFFDFGILIK